LTFSRITDSWSPASSSPPVWPWRWRSFKKANRYFRVTDFGKKNHSNGFSKEPKPHNIKKGNK